MKILLLSQWFDPEPNNMKALAFAKGLTERGHQVQVLTGLPNYPVGKLYPGYRFRLYQKEIMENILVHRVLLYPSHDASFIRRSLNYLSFAFLTAITAPWIIRGKIDIIYVYHPPVTVILPALILRKIKKAKILLDINDLWPDSIYCAGLLKNNRLWKLLNTIMNYAYRRADKINVLSSGIKQLLVQRGIEEKKITTIPVWCNEELVNQNKNQDFLNRYQLKERFTGIYAGAMGRAQNLSVLLQAAGQLSDTLPEFTLVLVGSGICLEELKEEAARAGLRQVIFIPLVPPKELSSLLNHADFLLIHLKNDPLLEITIPSKIAYYLALGKPVIAGLKGMPANMIEQSGAGFVCTPDTPSEMAQAILKLSKMSRKERTVLEVNARSYYREHLSMDTGLTAFLRVMEKMKEKNSNI